MFPSRSIATGLINKLYAEDNSAHDWYRFVMSFPPHLIRSYIQRFNLSKDSRIMDPFCGTGTTLVESKKFGIESIGIEAHPMMHFASSVKVNWTPDPISLLEHSELIASMATAKLAESGIEDDDNSYLFNSLDSQKMPLKTLVPEKSKLLLTNSISPLPLHKTLVLIETIEANRDERYYAHERLALAKALVSSISNLKFGPEVGIGKIKLNTAVIKHWMTAVETIAYDLRELREYEETASTVHLADARSLQKVLEPESVDAVITSPPYPNEKDYTRTTRLESVLLNLINGKEDLQSLKRGLLKSNTRTVYKNDSDDEFIAEHSEINRIADEIEKRRIELGKTSGFERLYSRVTKLYFGGMVRHLTNLRPFLRSGANLVYIVGDQSSFFRVPIRTGKLLAEIAESLGYKVVDIELFRSRISTLTKEQLREEAVILQWQDHSHQLTPTRFSCLIEHKQTMTKENESKKANRYAQIIERVFHLHYTKGSLEVRFTRDEFEAVAKELKISLPKNLGDIIYSFRYRVALPDSIRKLAPEGMHWVIRPAGRGVYSFALAPEYDISPNPNYDVIKVPDATPGLVAKYSLNDEQSLLAKLRYNRLIDIFTGVTCYSLQNHLRTFIPGIGQVETDEVYVGVDKQGVHHVFPVQAKGGKDKLNIVQIEQDFALCASRFPDLVCHPIGSQFLKNGAIALFEFKMSEEGVKITAEKHYELVSPDKVTQELLDTYKQILAVD